MIVSRLAQAALVLLGTLSAANAQMLRKPEAKRATVCNGYGELCSRTYGNVTYIGAHNSYAVASGADNLAANQDYDVTQQLTDGIRLLQVQSHLQGGAIRLCHSSCLLFDGGLISDYLKKVKAWMDKNPNEVVTILMVNIDNQPATMFDAAYKAAGLDTMAYVPTSPTVKADAWPTLGELIDSGKRLVVFMDNTADSSAVPYIIDEFTNIWETAFGVTTTDFPCTLNRTAGTAEGKMGLSNHFLDKYTSVVGIQTPVPDKASLNQTNAVSGVGSLGQESQTCSTLNGKQQTFYLVDYYNWGLGSVFQVGAAANGLAYNGQKIAPPITTTNSSSSSPARANAAAGLGVSWTDAGVIAAGALFGGVTLF